MRLSQLQCRLKQFGTQTIWVNRDAKDRSIACLGNSFQRSPHPQAIFLLRFVTTTIWAEVKPPSMVTLVVAHMTQSRSDTSGLGNSYTIVTLTTSCQFNFVCRRVGKMLAFVQTRFTVGWDVMLSKQRDRAAREVMASRVDNRGKVSTVEEKVYKSPGEFVGAPSLKKDWAAG